MAELLVLHLVELAEEFDHLLIRVAMIGGEVMAGTMHSGPQMIGTFCCSIIA